MSKIIKIKRDLLNFEDSYIYNEKVTISLKKVFQGLLIAVYIELEDCEQAYFEDNGDLSLDEKTVILEFTNGALVKYWNSEWGGLDKVEAENE